MHVLERPAPPPTRTSRYSALPTGLVDIFAPSTRSIGALVLIHGGFWRARYDRTHLRILAHALREEGWTVLLPEYRRVGDIGGGWPTTLMDVCTAIDAAPTLIGADLPRLVVAGHSAGGHLAVLAVGRVARPPDGVVSLAGVLDLHAAHRDRLSDGAVGQLLGSGDPAESELSAADPLLATSPPCKVTALHGQLDEEVPAEYSRRYAARHPGTVLTVLPDAGHYELIDPESQAYAIVRAALQAS